MKTINSMRVAKLRAASEMQMSVQRVTPNIDGIPCNDEICFTVSGHCVIEDIEIEEHVLLPMSEVRRLIGVLEVMTMHENEHMGIQPSINF
ncbi:MAG: hypothetical protein LBV41_08805 [Cytophagaceae bacterium]|jgi:hypothetical protein|nr:hypothetical protein [Cytophagaceae bacterium]